MFQNFRAQYCYHFEMIRDRIANSSKNCLFEYYIESYISIMYDNVSNRKLHTICITGNKTFATT